MATLRIQVFITFFLIILPLVFATQKPRKRNLTQMLCEKNSIESQAAITTFTQEQVQKLKQFEGEFDKFVDICTDGRYHQLPLNYYFFCHRDHADYLALAIKARDLEAIAFSKRYVQIEYPSTFLQAAILDMITQEDTDIIEALGNVFPNVYTNIFAFREPLEHLAGRSLIRIAVDNQRNKAAISMFKSVPLGMIADYWNTIDSMQKFILEAMAERQIRLKPDGNEVPLNNRVLIDMFFNCILENNLEALDYLHESTGIPLDITFVNENGLSSTAMFVAAHAGYPDIVSYLGKKCPKLFTVRSGTGMLPIHAAAANGHMDVIKSLSVARNTMTDAVDISGNMLTPFRLAIRNKKLRVAYLILSLIEKDEDIQAELRELAYLAILDDNEKLLDIYFEFNSFPAHGCIAGDYNLLEMALTGSIDPKKYHKNRSSIKCLMKLAEIWKEKDLPLNIAHDDVRGSILALLPPNDLDAFSTLIRIGKLHPNEIIFEISYIEGEIKVKRTTFLNRIVAQGATHMVPYAIRKGADPRIDDDDGLDVYETAKKFNNQFVINFFKANYDCY